MKATATHDSNTVSCMLICGKTHESNTVSCMLICGSCAFSTWGTSIMSSHRSRSDAKLGQRKQHKGTCTAIQAPKMGLSITQAKRGRDVASVSAGDGGADFGHGCACTDTTAVSFPAAS